MIFQSPGHPPIPVSQSYPSFVADQLMWSLLSVWPHSQGTKQVLSYSLPSHPSLCLSHQHQRHSLLRNPLVPRKSDPPGNQIFEADMLSSLLCTSSVPFPFQPVPIPVRSFRYLETSLRNRSVHTQGAQKYFQASNSLALHDSKIQRGPRNGKSNKDQITRPRTTIILNPDASIKIQPITAKRCRTICFH